MKSTIRFILTQIFRNQHVNEKLCLFFFRAVRAYYSNVLIQKYHRVLGGAYEGLKVPQIANHQNFTYVQITGMYEAFIQQIIDKKLSHHKKFIDIGCGCGHYTNGIAYKYHIPTLGVDLDPKQIEMANSIAKLNNLKDATHVAAQPGYDATEYLEDKALHLMDIEGGEWIVMEQMDPKNYKKASFLIELHKFGEKTVADTKAMIEKKFAKTHKITQLTEDFQRTDKGEEVYALIRDAGVPRQFSYMLLTEPRDYYQSWLLVEPTK